MTLGGVFSLGMSGRLESPPAPPPLVRSQVALPAGASFYLNPASPGPPTVSPDGRRLAFSALDSTGRTMLYVRSLASLDAHAIAGTENAAYLFWAPNSREIAFFSNGNLNRVDIAGGPVVPICPAENGKGGSWNTEDQILFAPTHVASVHLVAATGGEPVPVTSVEADTTARSHRFPCWLPDGRHFVYLSWRNGANSRSSGNETALRLGSTDGSVDRELMVSQTNAIYAGGRLLHVHESNLMSRPFSWRDLEFTGPPQPVLGGVLALQAAHVAVFSATDAGVLAYVAGDGIFGMSQLQWVGPAAEELDILPGTFASPQGISVAPDGKHVAVSQADERAGTYDIWVYKVGREVGARFTFANESEQNPIWTPDSRWITYAGFSPNGLAIFRKLASGAGRPEVLLDIADNCFPSGWSHDGSRLAIDRVNESGDYDIWFLDHGRTDSLQVFRATPFNEGNARFSADDRWLAYTSDETGMLEIFVESLAGDGGRYRVSSHSGLHPLWSPDGSQIYYLDTGGNLLATRVDTATGSLVIGETVTIARGLEVSRLKTHAVDASSGRLLIQRSLQDRVSDRLQLVTGWQNLLKDTSDN